MKIGELLRKWRAVSELDLRQGAAIIGVSVSTLRRIEAGVVPDGATVIKLMQWAFATEEVPQSPPVSEVSHE